MKHSLLFILYSILPLLFLTSKISAQEFQTINEPSKNKTYNNAVALADQAITALKQGEYPTADSLIKLSIQLYPTLRSLDYSLEIGKLFDWKTANFFVEQVLTAIHNYPDKNIQVLEPYPSGFEDGKFIRKINNYDKAHASLFFIHQQFQNNQLLGSKQGIVQGLQALKNLQVTPFKKSKVPNIDIGQLVYNSLLITCYMYEKDITNAIATVKKNHITGNDVSDLIQLFWIHFVAEQYEKCEELLEDIPYEEAKNISAFILYTQLAETAKAEFYYTKLPENSKQFTSVIYYWGLCLQQNKKYEQSIVNFKTALTKVDTIIGINIIVDKWPIYKSLADSYQSMGDFQRARDNYQIALLYDSTYTEATEALRKMNTVYHQEDKEGPEIFLTEPNSQRGLEIVSANDKTLIKGYTRDISGTSNVIINNLPAYVQKNGDFWAEVPLQNNTITIEAIDQKGNRSIKIINVKTEVNTLADNSTEEPISSTNYCLLIAAQNYQDIQIPSLSNPVADAIKLKRIIKEQYGFQENHISTLFNPSLHDLNRMLKELASILNPDDNLLIFYAGHGIWSEKEKKGYWLLTDAEYNVPSSWASNKDILNLIAGIPSRNILLISDACFSGSVFKTRSLTKNTAVQNLKNKISRVAITSGNDSEVPDESIFMKYLIKALSDNKEQTVSAQNLFVNHIIEAVMNSTETEPRYGTLEEAGHIGGDYIFQKNKQ